MHREFVTIFRRTRPRRSYQNFRFFCLAHGGDRARPYPCLACRGQGQIDEPADPPCPVEGDGHVRRIRCAECQGSGKGTQEACRRACQASVDAYHREKVENDRLVGFRREALQKLTKDENAALRKLVSVRKCVGCNPRIALGCTV